MVCFKTILKSPGIRKVLGASVASVVTLLSADFLKLVVIAIIIASPIGWYIMNTWLQSLPTKLVLNGGFLHLPDQCPL